MQRTRACAPTPAAGRPIGLSDLFDGVCPSLYISERVDDAEADVDAFVRECVNAARQYGKPVYPFLRDVYVANGEPVDLTIWCRQLREVCRHADGAVVWGDSRPAWRPQNALRLRAATLIAKRRGEITDAELYDALKDEFRNEADLKTLLHETAATKPASRP